MLVNVTLIPFLLAVTGNVSLKDGEEFAPEYVYNMQKIATVHGDSLQNVHYNSTVRCHLTDPKSLRCLLHDISVVSYKNLNITNHEIANEKLDSVDWFDLKFNRGMDRDLYQGLYQIEISIDRKTEREDMIEEFADQLSIGSSLKSRRNYSAYSSEFTLFDEKITRGTCVTMYKISATSEEDTEERNFRISFIELPEFINKKTVLIKKSRHKCTFIPTFNVFLNELELNSYTHIMEVTGDKFKISTTMDVRIPPDEWNIQGREVFTSKIMVNLMSIESTRTEISKGPGFA
ncbi:PREDICTED: uncharacterized protein LOC105452356 isoform X1 [Wasmannia auropunctata]|uniref:uncharacterized protein LOC105452356 isoform X1 n=2 Tax=Wasmannia auropunctata TaxID=64793 RepID=UPI0005ED7046|nr:PREDICTED: uncharacterized protein LOC105452356 isoform X1 [Wasmannia auropunctata]XP_011691679.1 PREDICTED: uncharacterized protein LOC105452356 isoform X1 [Wasmannia auropunctata]XP_011691680.1 PREDICTED: uncharacterized protein LOC105452356 isoform X1 [Wasmannia auropunctata]XP_011691682.1 PREDICTED: uncharacterized protein LOC105452356 isoform X1 [Wasmannia auropunctata]